MIANNDGENSFFVSIDGGNYLEWHTQIGGNETWIWDQVRDGWVKDGNTVYLDLDAGIHNLTIRQREDGTKIDQILLTNDLRYIPNE